MISKTVTLMGRMKSCQAPFGSGQHGMIRHPMEADEFYG